MISKKSLDKELVEKLMGQPMKKRSQLIPNDLGHISMATLKLGDKQGFFGWF